MSFKTAEARVREERKKFEQKQERIKKGKMIKENPDNWKLGYFFKECR